jgi:hypothetical protein
MTADPRTPDVPTRPSYPRPQNKFELKGYRTYRVAEFVDALVRSTAQLARAIVFLWLGLVIPVLLMMFMMSHSVHVDWRALALEWRSLAAIGGLGTIAICGSGLAMAWRTWVPERSRTTASTAIADRADPSTAEACAAPDPTESRPAD